MTRPVKPSIEEQIRAVQRVVAVLVHHTVFEDVISPLHREGLRAVLATLSQHKRAMAVVEAARAYRDCTDANELDAEAALFAALDTAETEQVR